MRYVSIAEYYALIRGQSLPSEPDDGTVAGEEPEVTPTESPAETPAETGTDNGTGDDAVEIALAAAESLVDAATLYGFVGRDPDDLPEYIAARLRETVAYQAQYILQQGGADAMNDGSDALGSVSLGKYSYSRGATRGSGGDNNNGSVLPLSSLASANIPLLRAYVRTLWKGGAPS